MSTINRRQLRPRPLTAAAAQMLRFIRSTDGSRTPAEVVAASGIRPGWAWNAITQLQERGYVLLDGGRLTITRAGSQAASRTAA